MSAPYSPLHDPSPHPSPSPPPSSLSPSSTSSSLAPISTRVLVSGRTDVVDVDAYDLLAAALVPGSVQGTDYRGVGSRWLVLSLFVCVGALQSAVWATYSTVPLYANRYFFQDPPSSHLLDLLLNWGCIIYLPAVFFAAWVLTHPSGLRLSVTLAACLCFLAATLRSLVTFFPIDTRERFLDQWILLAHAAQIINAIAGPLLLSAPSKLSLAWFPDAERATATAIASVSPGVGIGAAYLMGPAMVGEAAGLAGLLRLFWYIAAGLALGTLLFFADKPPRYPSASAAERDLFLESSLTSSSPFSLSFFRGIRLAASSFSFLLLVLAAALVNGIYMGWYSTLPTQLLPLQYSQQQSGSFTSITRFACIAGGVAAGRMTDAGEKGRRMRAAGRRGKMGGRLKALLVGSLLLAVLPFCFFTLSVPSVAYPSPPLPNNYLFLFSSVAFAGFCIGAATPLFYELAAELTFPAPESTAASLLTLFSQICGLVIFSLSPSIDLGKLNILMTVGVGAAVVLAAMVQEQYKRAEAGEGFRVKNEGVAAVLQYYQENEGQNVII